MGQLYYCLLPALYDLVFHLSGEVNHTTLGWLNPALTLVTLLVGILCARTMTRWEVFLSALLTSAVLLLLDLIDSFTLLPPIAFRQWAFWPRLYIRHLGFSKQLSARITSLLPLALCLFGQWEKSEKNEKIPPKFR